MRHVEALIGEEPEQCNKVRRGGMFRASKLEGVEIEGNDFKYILSRYLINRYLDSGDYDKVMEVAMDLDEYYRKVILFGECALRFWVNGYEVDEKGKKLLHDMIYEVSKPIGI